MKRLWIAAAFVVAVTAAGCNRWDDYPQGNPYYQPYYQQPYAQPYYSQPAPPAYQSGTTYAQPAVGPCTPAAVKATPAR
jgi:hypothetical protein